MVLIGVVRVHFKKTGGKEAEGKVNIRMINGRVWKPPAVASRVKCVQTGEVFMGERLEKMDLDPVLVPRAKQPPAAPTAGGNRKKAVEVARRAMGAETTVALTLRELAAISPVWRTK